MGRKTPHTATYMHHMVKVRLKSGEIFFDRFIDRKSGVVIFKTRKVRKADIVAFTPYHANNHGTANRK